jgi:enoyl-CoA hydratase/carnithine racemase
MNGPLLSRREGAVLVLLNNNPVARNALSPAFSLALKQALDEAQADPQIGAIVLTGVDGMFCSGGDLRQLAQRRSKPVIAAVEGAAAGAGLSMALACDMLVTARNAVFSLAYVKVGLTPDGGATAFLAEFVSRQILTELCLTGDRFNGERLHALGAVNRLTEPGGALNEAVALATSVATGPLRAMASIKALCRSAPHATFEAQMEDEARYMVQAQGDDEAAEGIAAFLEKRSADFVSLRAGHSSQPSDTPADDQQTH